MFSIKSAGADVVELSLPLVELDVLPPDANNELFTAPGFWEGPVSALRAELDWNGGIGCTSRESIGNDLECCEPLPVESVICAGSCGDTGPRSSTVGARPN